jgi:glutamine amidotransferase
MMISIVNYGLGNIASLRNMLHYIGIETEIAVNASSVKKAKKLIMPGVGAFDAAMHAINSIDGLRDALNEQVMIRKVPIMGICLGMQLMMTSSEEGDLEGLDWISGSVNKFTPTHEHKVPHMGWAVPRQTCRSPLFKGLDLADRFYFVHSYYAKVQQESEAIMKCQYIIDFDAAINKENIYGVQFHPEKSHRYGMKLLKNFNEI